jgi:general secretion pathway protein F
LAAFEFTALNDKGKEVSGVQEGDTPRQVRQVLREKGWMPLKVEEVRQREARQQKAQFTFKRGVGATDLALFTRQLSTLVQSGSPIEEALQAVSRQTEKPRIKSMIMGVRSRVMEGHSLAAATNDFPQMFNELYRSTIEAGEQSGHLDRVLDRLADYTESRQAMQQNLVQAMVYPILITLVALGVVSVLMVAVVPKVVEMFDYIDQQLPLITRILISISDFVGNWGGITVIALLLLFLVVQQILRRPQPKKKFHAWLLRVPLVSRLVMGMNTARFARTLSILTASGVPVLEALRIAGQVLVNIPMREAVTEASRRIREGAGIARSLEASGYFPPMTVHLIASGESSGRLEEMLERAAESQEREMTMLLNMAVKLFEPFMLIFMGLITAGIVMAIMIPILDMNTLVK